MLAADAGLTGAAGDPVGDPDPEPVTGRFDQPGQASGDQPGEGRGQEQDHADLFDGRRSTGR